jgi:hypothetical protein
METSNYKGFQGCARNRRSRLESRMQAWTRFALNREGASKAVPALGNVWFRHYNAGMRSGIAPWSLGRSLTAVVMVWGIWLFPPPLIAAQRFLADDSSLANSRTTDAPKVIFAPASPAIQPRTSGLAPPHVFWDRTNVTLFSGIAVTRGVDYASTRNFLARGRQEILLPDDVINNSAGFASLEVAATVTSVGIAYLLHRTGHHQLERWVSVGHISVTAFGDVRNYALESRHHR